MKKAPVLTIPREVLKDMELIARYEKVKLSRWVRWLNYSFNNYIQTKKNSIMKSIEGMWLLDKITDNEFKKLTGINVPKSLMCEKEVWKKNAELYKENARKALLMNIQ